MKPSKIIFKKPLNKKEVLSGPTNPLAISYTEARAELQKTDIELQRSKIIVLDSQGNLIRLKLLQEH